MILDADLLRRAKKDNLLRLATWLQARGELSAIPTAHGHVVTTVARVLEKLSHQSFLDRLDEQIRELEEKVEDPR